MLHVGYRLCITKCFGGTELKRSYIRGYEKQKRVEYPLSSPAVSSLRGDICAAGPTVLLGSSYPEGC